MAHIVAFSLSSEGHLYPFIPILIELARRGHRVSLALPLADEGPPDFEGIPVFRVPWSAPGESAPGEKLRLAAFPSLAVFSAHGEPLAQGLEHVIMQHNPEFILVDPYLWGGLIAAEAARCAWAALAHNPLSFSGRGTDPRGPGLPPARTWFSRWRSRALATTMELETSEHLAAVNHVRARRALPPLGRMKDLHTTAPLTLATTAPPFEYPRDDWPVSLKFVGPMIWDRPSAEGTGFESDASKPLILVSDSTVANRGLGANWASSVLDALASEPYRVIGTLPTQTGLIPHSTILPHASCVICHGGAGIVNKALWFGVPVVAVPFALDRFEVARRVEVSGAGVMLPLSRLSRPDEIRMAVRRALQCRERAEWLSRQLRAAGGPADAADLVESQLKARLAHA